MKTLRLFALLDRLRASTGPISAEVLAGDLGVSCRTIYRDMATLQTMGAPVRGEAGLGYQMDKGYFLPPLHLDADEMEAVLLGVRLVSARADDALGLAARRAFGKIASTLGPEAEDRFRNLPMRAVSRQTPERAGAHRVLSLLRRAIRTRAVLALGYRGADDLASQRPVRPLGLTLFDTVWLLTAWCETRDDFRNFRLDRILTVEEAGRAFRHENGKRFGDYLKTL